MNKKILSIILAVLLISVGLFSGCKSDADSQNNNNGKVESGDVVIVDATRDFMVYTDGTHVERADKIITGKIVDIEFDEIRLDEDAEKERVIYYTIQIKKVLKGDLKVNTKAKFLVAGDGKKFISQQIMDTGGYMKKGDNVLMFLKNLEDYFIEDYKKFNNKDADFHLIHHLQGRIWLDKNYEIDKEKNDFEAMHLDSIRSVSDIEHIMKTDDITTEYAQHLFVPYSDSELIKNSENIVIGKKIENGTEFQNIPVDAAGRTKQLTIYSMQVEKVIKGNLKVGDIIKYGELLSTKAATSKHAIKNGESAIIFTQSTEDAANQYGYINPQDYDVYFTTSNTQAFIWLNEKGEIDQQENNFEARNLTTIRKVADIEAMVK